MNSYNQNKIGNNITRYKNTNKDAYTLLLSKFTDNVKNTISNILMTDKKMTENEANITVNKLFNIDHNRKQTILEDIENDYTKGKTEKECAKNILNKYYKILLVNNDQDNGVYDNVEVNESLRDKLKGKSENEIIKQIEEKSPNLITQIYNFAKYGFIDRFKEEVEKTSNQLTLDKLLRMCASLSDVNIVKILMDNGAKIINEKGKNNALQTAFIYFNIFKYLVDNTDINDFNDSDHKILLQAVHYDKSKYVELLLNKFNYDLNTIEWMIKHAKSYNYEDIVKLLKDYKNKHYPSKLKRFKNYIGMNESNEYKQVSLTFFNSFINKIKDLDAKFILDTTYIKGINNSLNNPTYDLFLTTNDINKTYVIDEFKYSKIMSNITNYIKDVNTIRFYIGINSESIHFGFMIDNKLYKIGFNKYTSTDLIKIKDLIDKTDKTININYLFKRIKSKLMLFRFINKKIKYYLSNYDSIKINKHIINDKFTFVIETTNNDIININYLNRILTEKQINHVNFKIDREIKNNKIYYYITIL